MKTLSPISIERRAAAAFLTFAVGTFIGVAASAVTPSLFIQVAVALCVPLFATAAVARRLPADFDGMFKARPWLALLWSVVTLLSAARLAGLAVFMAHPDMPQAAPMWFDEFYLDHSCFSAWWKATQFAHQGVHNLYDKSLYVPLMEGRFWLDEYIYPPPFLLLGEAFHRAGASFLQTRACWYTLESLLFMGALWGLFAWIGGPTGKRAAAWLPIFWLNTPVLLTLQTGNFQLAALSLSVLGMLSFDRRRYVLGGLLLGFAMLKIYPGILCAWLLFSGRWRALAAAVICFAGYTGLAWLALGPLPFQAFFHEMWPVMQSGELWWHWIDKPSTAIVSAINDSVPGVLLKLKVLGVNGIEHKMLGPASQIWSLIVIAAAWFASRRAATQSRGLMALTWLALLGLCALRSPFVPDQYALIPGIWIWCMVATEDASPSLLRKLAIPVLWVVLAMVEPFDTLTDHDVSLKMISALTLSGQVTMVALLAWIILRRERVGHPQQSERPLAFGQLAQTSI